MSTLSFHLDHGAEGIVSKADRCPISVGAALGMDQGAQSGERRGAARA
jgi:hypothetical protein